MWNLASGFRRSIRDSLFFVTLVTLVVFQSMSLYRFHYLYDGLDTVEVTEKPPQWFVFLYVLIYIYELCLYLIAFLAMTCMTCGVAVVCYETYQRRFRRR